MCQPQVALQGSHDHTTPPQYIFQKNHSLHPQFLELEAGYGNIYPLAPTLEHKTANNIAF